MSEPGKRPRGRPPTLSENGEPTVRLLIRLPEPMYVEMLAAVGAQAKGSGQAHVAGFVRAAIQAALARGGRD